MPHECSSKNCTMIGVWLPQINVHDKDTKDFYEFQISLIYCNLCKRLKRLEDQLTDECWKMICEILTEAKQNIIPVRESTTFEWVKASNHRHIIPVKEKS